MKTLAMIMAAVGVFLAGGALANAEMVYSSYYDITQDPDPTYDAWNYTSPDPEMVEPFTSAPNALGEWDLTQVALCAYAGGIMGGVPSPVTVTIYFAEPVGPDTIVDGAQWVVSIGGYPGDDFTFPVSGVSLDAGVNYWFGVAPNEPFAGGWLRVYPIAPTGVTGHVFRLAGTEVPEPGTVALLVLGGIGLLIRRRRRGMA